MIIENVKFMAITNDISSYCLSAMVEVVVSGGVGVSWGGWKTNSKDSLQWF